MESHRTKEMPDIANEPISRSSLSSKIAKVGMSNIEIPLLLPSQKDPGLPPSLSHGVASAYVSLDDASAKGIHMSRLFLTLMSLCQKETVSFSLMRQILDEFLQTHRGLSESAFCEIEYQLPLDRPALVSKQIGFRTYPVKITGSFKKGEYRFELSVQILYSSTCPCSAALARQLIREKFLEDFKSRKTIEPSEVENWLSSPNGIIATPHSQRSRVDLTVALTDQDLASHHITPEELVLFLEDTLKTPVQAAVKREDEQRFALLNGQNLMFCEDAARKVTAALEGTYPWIQHYRARFDHFESLHPHDATSMICKGDYEF